jgi:hypothetical protein
MSVNGDCQVVGQWEERERDREREREREEEVWGGDEEIVQLNPPSAA